MARRAYLTFALSLGLIAGSLIPAHSAPNVTNVDTGFVIAGSGVIVGHPLGELADVFVYELDHGLVHVEVYFCPNPLVSQGPCTRRVVEAVPDVYRAESPTRKRLDILGSSLGDIKLDLTHAAESNGWSSAVCPVSWNLGPFAVVGRVTNLEANMYGEIDGHGAAISRSFGGCSLFGEDVTFQFTAVR